MLRITPAAAREPRPETADDAPFLRDGFAGPFLGSVVTYLGAKDVMATSMTCRALYQALSPAALTRAGSDGSPGALVWRALLVSDFGLDCNALDGLFAETRTRCTPPPCAMPSPKARPDDDEAEAAADDEVAALLATPALAPGPSDSPQAMPPLTSTPLPLVAAQAKPGDSDGLASPQDTPSRKTESGSRPPSASVDTPVTLDEPTVRPWPGFAQRYSYAELYQLLHTHRCCRWYEHLNVHRRTGRALLARDGNVAAAAGAATKCLEPQLQTGVSGNDVLCAMLADDLCTRAALFVFAARKATAHEDPTAGLSAFGMPLCALATAVELSIDVALMRTLVAQHSAALDDSHAVLPATFFRVALGDLAMALLLRGSAWPAAPHVYSLAVEATLALGSPPFVGPAFNFDEMYDAVVLRGTAIDRAGFLFQAQYWRGQCFSTALHQYLICDMLKFWPEARIREAKRHARHQHESLICEAWLLYDRNERDAATRAVELAVSLLPKTCMCPLPAAQEARDAAIVTDSATAGLASPPGEERLGPSTSTPDMVVPPGPTSRVYGPEVEVCGNCGCTLEMTSSAAMAYFTMGFTSRDTDIALTAYMQYFRYYPLPARRSITSNNIGSLFLHRKQYDTAMLWLRRSLECNPHYYMTYRNIARCYARMDEFQSAYETLTTAITMCRPIPSDAYADRSKYIVATHSRRDLTVATRLNPRLSHPYRCRAAMLMDSGFGAEAVAEISRVIELRLDSYDVSLRAAFHRDLGMTEEAQADMALALTLDPVNNVLLSWVKARVPDDAPLIALPRTLLR